MLAANPTHLSLTPLCVLCVSVFSSPNLSPFNFKLSTFNCFSPKSRRIRTYEKCARNSFRMNTSKTKDLKLFRINTYKKTGEGVPPGSRRGISRKTRPFEGTISRLLGSFRSGAGSWDDEAVEMKSRRFGHGTQSADSGAGHRRAGRPPGIAPFRVACRR